MPTLKTFVRALINRLGYNISRQHSEELGSCPISDMRHFVLADQSPVILDVGANIGQSANRFKATFPSSIIHCFEPGSDTFKDLKKNISDKNNVFAWNLALGATVGNQTFNENIHSVMSSFLELDETGWGKINEQKVVDVTTIDEFLTTRNINSVDILKSDTQGYDFEVFKGAEQAMRDNRIGLIYFEFIFSNMYKNLPPFDQVFRYLIDRDFLLVSIYEFHHQNSLASWSDALFINKEYYHKWSSIQKM